MTISSIEAGVSDCAACGQHHARLIFVPATPALVLNGQSYGFRTACPVTGRDLYLRIATDIVGAPLTGSWAVLHRARVNAGAAWSGWFINGRKITSDHAEQIVRAYADMLATGTVDVRTMADDDVDTFLREAAG